MTGFLPNTGTGSQRVYMKEDMIEGTVRVGYFV